MTLKEISAGYSETAALLRKKLHDLRLEAKTETDPEKLFWIKQRCLLLGRIMNQQNELADLTAHYYEKGYYRSETYCF